MGIDNSNQSSETLYDQQRAAEISLNNKGETEREPWVDFVKVIAIFLVVLLHSAAPWLYRFGQVSNFDWQIGNIIDSATRVSVPLFFMSTGYLLLSKPVSLKTYFNKRMKRIVVPWLAWSFIYLVYKSLRSGIPITIPEGFLEFLNGDVYFHFWFLYALVGLYLFIPIISWFIETDSQRRSLYFLIAWIITASVIPFLNTVARYTTNYELNIAIDLSMFAGFSGYLITGLLIGKFKSSKPHLIAIVIACATGIALTIAGTSMGTYRLGRLAEYFYEYTAPNVVLAAFAAFAILKRIGMTIRQNTKLSYAFARMGYATLGIYLIHPMILNALNDGVFGFGLARAIQTSAYTIPLVAVISFLLSYIVIEIISYIPIVRKII
jgi:surface polysaccharide O-acyltransferase-like enzyme